MIKVEHIYQKYGTHEVLNDVNLVFEDQKITALIGQNGSGKTTLFNVISGLIKPYKGAIYIDSENVTSYKPRALAKKIAILKQSNDLHIRITIRDLVSFGRYPHSQGKLKPEDSQKINDALAYMKLEAIEDKFLDELSGGQKQRAYIAMILAQDTPYIILDEPLNNLDIKFSIEMMMILRRLVKDFNKTVIIVLHDINIASAFADRIVAMKDGTIYEEGDVKKMMDKRILDTVFDHDFCIAGHGGYKYCVYHHELKEIERD